MARRYPRRFRDYRSVGQPVGALVASLGAVIGLCAAAGGVLEGLEERAGPGIGGTLALIVASGVALVLGLGLYTYGKRHASAGLTRREAVLAVAAIWVAAGVCGALPFALGVGMHPIDAFFETMSGLTTTGATIVTDIEGQLPRSLLLWRSLLQWLGGMGIVVLFVAVFPSVGAGGKHMFRGEMPGATAEGLKPRIAETSFTLWKVYAAFTALEVVVLILLEVDPFEAVCHALTTMATGGFSTRNASIAGFGKPAVEFAISIFMLVGAVNFGLYYAILRGGKLNRVLQSVELRIFAAIVVLATMVLTLVTLPQRGGDLLASFRSSLFMVATFVSSTGYTTEDYMLYPPVGLAVVLFLMFVGGCSGSTAGGVKIERLVLMAKQSWAEIHQSFRPSVVRVVRMGRSVIERSVLADVAAFFVVYMGSLTLTVFAVTAIEGVPVPTAFGAALSCFSNMGPAPFHAGADNFASYAPVTKLLFAFAMVFGRLEFFTLLALMVPDFWKR